MRIPPLCFLAVLLAAHPGLASPVAPIDAAATGLQGRVAALSAGQSLRIGDETIVSRVALPRIYTASGYRLLWQDPARRAALRTEIAAAADDGLVPEDFHAKALASQDIGAADFDLLATDAYVLLLYQLYLGKVAPTAVEPDWNFKQRAVREADAINFIVKAVSSGQIHESAEQLRPHHWLYERGRRTLARYRALERDGGWPTITPGPKLGPGANDPRVPVLRERLTITGDYTGPASASTDFDAPLADALRVFQTRHLLDADGIVGPGTLRELNVPVSQRIAQLRINLERGRWVLHEIEDGDLVVVDVAGYGVRYLRDRKAIWRSRAIVGQPFRQTPIFRATIDNVVFNPTWTVPPGILAKDILPQMQRGDNVLARKRLKVYDRAGKPVDPSGIAWSQYTARNFPYVLRQDAGDDNALGHVKINFPNPHLVYLHDTPSRALFDKYDRSFSSGCIRVDRPLELTELLLAGNGGWDRTAIRAAVDKGETRTVTLSRKVPVLIIYWTADEDQDGRVVFKRDVYKRDDKLRRALDGTFSVGGRPKV